MNKDVMKSILIYNNENLLSSLNKGDLVNFSLYFEEIDFSTSVKNHWKKASKIININNNDVQIAIKVNGLWKIFDSLNLEYLYCKKNKINIKYSFSDLEKNSDVIFDEGNALYSEEYLNANYIKKINWALSDNFYNDVETIYESEGYISYEYREVKLTEQADFTSFKKMLFSTEGIDGIGVEKIIEKNDRIIITNNYGEFVLSVNNEVIKITSIICSRSTEEEISTYKRATATNIINNINRNTGYKKSDIPKQIIKSLIGIAIFALLFSMTFLLLFDSENISIFFRAFGNVNSWNAPWLYLIICTFIINLLMPIIVAVFVEKLILKKEEFEFKRVLHYFVASALRNSATFLTGNIFVAMFAWTWYLSKSLKIRTASLVSAFSTAAIIRAMIISMFGVVFMTIGTIGFFTIFDSPVTSVNLAVVISSWIGFVWQIIHGSAIYFLIISPVVLRFFIVLSFRMKNFRKEYKISDVNELNNKFNSFLKGRLSITWKENRERIYTLTSLTVAAILIEGIETVFYFNYVEHLLCFTTNNQEYYYAYWNIGSIISLRYMASQIHHVPIINILPGRGIFFSEFGLNTLYASVFEKHHANIPPGTFDLTSEDLAQITSFSTRFFNVYLRYSIFIVISFITISVTMVSRKKEDTL